MSFPTIQVDFSRPIWVVVLLISFAIFESCSPATPRPPQLMQMTQLQVRQIQTREYSGGTEIAAMRAVVAALQDEGFIVETTSQGLGLITAGKEIFEEDEDSKQWLKFMYGTGIGSYQTTKRFEVNATIRKSQDGVKVRINIVAKALSNTGGILWSQPVQEPTIYQNLFARVDKAVFLENQKL